MKNKVLLMLAVITCTLIPVQEKAQATSAGETWGIIGTALGGTALGLQALNSFRGRRQGYSYGGGYYNRPMNNYYNYNNYQSYYPAQTYSQTYYAQPTYTNTYHSYYNRPTQYVCPNNSYGFYGGY